MPETFLILLAGGVLLPAAVSDPRAVTLRWLRLAGIIALSVAGVAWFFYLRRETPPTGSVVVRYVQRGLMVATVLAILGQLAFVQIAWRTTQRVLAAVAFGLAVLAGSHLLHELMVERGTATTPPPKALAMALQTLTCAGVSAMCGLVLMDMLLGHAYLTASKMGIEPFRRLNAVAGITTFARAAIAVGGTMLVDRGVYSVPKLWQVHGLSIGTRWAVGLLIPLIFLHMAHDCIKRRSTQSATGILYVAGVLVFVGEMVALYLVRETGLPF